MKIIFTLLSIIAILNLNAQSTIVSAANGNASNPLTWNCLCIPLPGDNITINHNVVLDVNWGYTSGSLTINAGKSLTGNTTDRILAVGGGTFVNNGTTDMAYVYHSGGTFTNNGTMTISQSFGVNTGATTINNATFNVADSLYINATFNNNNVLTAFATANAGTFNNAGSFTTGDLWNSGTITNSALPGMMITNDIYSSGTITNGTHISVDRDVWNSENFTNNDYLVVGRDLWTGDSVQLTANFTNNGLVSVANDFYCNQTVTGTGDFCIANYTANAGSITGTLDICDLTGGSFDLNAGTIAGTVTFCTSSCAVGVEEEETTLLNVFPNPFEDVLKIQMEGYTNVQFVLQNILGQKIMNKNIIGNTTIAVLDVDPGVYFYSFVQDGKIISSGKLLKK